MDFGRCSVALSMALVLLTACKGEHQRAYTPADASEEVAEAQAEAMQDSLAESAAEGAMPTAADELFDDFFFNYAASQRLQLERTDFPLPVVSDGSARSIDRRQWKMERFFMDQDYYTLIFDSPEQMELVKDTAVSEAVVERIMLTEEKVCQYRFNRRQGIWKLREISEEQLLRNANAQFLKFYEQFVTDSVFQHQSLAGQIAFVGPDPEDDFQMIEGVITPDFWDAFAPEFPKDRIYNIVYGHQNPAATQKIFVIRGIANGLEVEVTFRLQRGRWKVTKLIT